MKSFAIALAALSMTLPAAAAESGWNGRWVLSQTRNPSEIKAQAAEDYAFTLGAHESIRWEIPSLKEVVMGKVDGRPMVISRGGVDTTLTLSVTADGPYVLQYKVARNGQPEGEGRMTLVEDGKAWVDISGPAGDPQHTGAVIYERPN